MICNKFNSIVLSVCMAFCLVLLVSTTSEAVRGRSLCNTFGGCGGWKSESRSLCNTFGGCGGWRSTSKAMCKNTPGCVWDSEINRALYPTFGGYGPMSLCNYFCGCSNCDRWRPQMLEALGIKEDPLAKK